MAYKVEEDYRRNDGRGWEWELGIMVWGEDTTLTERTWRTMETPLINSIVLCRCNFDSLYS